MGIWPSWSPRAGDMLASQMLHHIIYRASLDHQQIVIQECTRVLGLPEDPALNPARYKGVKQAWTAVQGVSHPEWHAIIEILEQIV